jgi:hypothetical protein
MPSQCSRTVLAKSRKALRPAAHCPTVPPGKFRFGTVAVGVSVNRLESFTKTHRPAKFSVLSTEVFALLLTLLAEVPTVTAQAPHRPFEIDSLALKFAPDLIECLAGDLRSKSIITANAKRYLRRLDSRPSRQKADQSVQSFSSNEESVVQSNRSRHFLTGRGQALYAHQHVFASMGFSSTCSDCMSNSNHLRYSLACRCGSLANVHDILRLYSAHYYYASFWV